MARPREFDRAEVLTQAMHLFWQQGYERTSLKELTDTMGISAPSLYNAFGDKKALYDEAVALYSTTSAVVVPHAVGEPTARDVVAKILDVAVREYCSVEHPPGCFVISDPILADHRRDGLEAIRTRLRRAVDDGDVPADADVDALTEFVGVVLRGMSSLARDGANAETLRAVADVALSAWPAVGVDAV
ncbi:TetR/AcrR family transcriptional regulator [Mycobacterium yunnanensis]|uniref:TetR/AcrR family transcriptional regulator n=1 Tax=Mycobacterium yunnanensis TaxID=368477 RepID=A0A9X2YZL6_9MYCO|nr:TetR/AcrR family transcriptional regulator [Mycobacterium yunnanensis]MCV7420421.1 TetR/AcrR family transcriptional regulator [Mycobacterium yunnanensis]